MRTVPPKALAELERVEPPANRDRVAPALHRARVAPELAERVPAERLRVERPERAGPRALQERAAPQVRQEVHPAAAPERAAHPWAVQVAPQALAREAPVVVVLVHQAWEARPGALAVAVAPQVSRT